jgi:hypothetical protein
MKQKNKNKNITEANMIRRIMRRAKKKRREEVVEN